MNMQEITDTGPIGMGVWRGFEESPRQLGDREVRDLGGLALQRTEQVVGSFGSELGRLAMELLGAPTDTASHDHYPSMSELGLAA